MKKLALAMAVTAVSSASYAACPPGGSCENDCSGQQVVGSIPAAIVLDTTVRDALQAESFGAGSACIGNSTELCMPGVSSAELISLFAEPPATWSSITNESTNVVLCGRSNTTPESQALINAGEGLIAITAETAFDTCMQPGSGKKGINARSIGVGGIDASDPAYGFVKLDGVAPTLAQHVSANYNLVANVCGAATFPTVATAFGTAGGAAIADGAPVKHSGGTSSPALPPRVLNGGILAPDSP